MIALRRTKAGFPRVVLAGASAYRRGVIVRRFLSLLVLLGLVLGPIAMPGAGPALAMGEHASAMAKQEFAAVEPAHPCHEGQTSEDKQTPANNAAANCCVTTCVALPPIEDELAARTAQVRIHLPIPRMRDPYGFRPEAEPPPPRFS